MFSNGVVLKSWEPNRDFNGLQGLSSHEWYWGSPNCIPSPSSFPRRMPNGTIDVLWFRRELQLWNPLCGDCSLGLIHSTSKSGHYCTNMHYILNKRSYEQYIDYSCVNFSACISVFRQDTLLIVPDCIWPAGRLLSLLSKWQRCSVDWFDPKSITIPINSNAIFPTQGNYRQSREERKDVRKRKSNRKNKVGHVGHAVVGTTRTQGEGATTITTVAEFLDYGRKVGC